MLDQESRPSIDELFRLVMLDRTRMVRITIELRDEDGDEVPINDLVEQLTSYISDKIKDENPNKCKQQILPLMSQAVVNGMAKLMGEGWATVMLSHSPTRISLVHMMATGFYLMKLIQKKGYEIHTFEETVTQDEVERYDRLSKANDIVMQVASTGGDPKDVIRKLVQSGHLKRSDIEDIADEVLGDDDHREVN